MQNNVQFLSFLFKLRILSNAPLKHNYYPCMLFYDVPHTENGFTKNKLITTHVKKT